MRDLTWTRGQGAWDLIRTRGLVIRPHQWVEQSLASIQSHQLPFYFWKTMARYVLYNIILIYVCHISAVRKRIGCDAGQGYVCLCSWKSIIDVYYKLNVTKMKGPLVDKFCFDIK